MGWCNRAEMFDLLNYQLLNLLKNIIAKKQSVIMDMMSLNNLSEIKIARKWNDVFNSRSFGSSISCANLIVFIGFIMNTMSS